MNYHTRIEILGLGAVGVSRFGALECNAVFIGSMGCRVQVNMVGSWRVGLQEERVRVDGWPEMVWI